MQIDDDDDDDDGRSTDALSAGRRNEECNSNWNFILCSKRVGFNMIAFTSMDGLEKYLAVARKSANEWNHLATSHSLHKEGIAMPLLEGIPVTKRTGANDAYMSIARFSSPPGAEHRPFDEKHDRHTYCTIKKSNTPFYQKFSLQFSPDAHDSSQSFCIGLYIHNRLPIADTSSYHGRRYRFVHTELQSSWNYGVYELDQESIIDMEDNIDEHKSSSEFIKASRRIGELKSFESKFKQYASNSAVLEYPSHLESQYRLTDSINAVREDALVFICISMILKRNQEERRRTRSATKIQRRK